MAKVKKQNFGHNPNLTSKIAKEKLKSRDVFKKSPRATIVYKGSDNKHFKQEWEQQGAFLAWK